jgi:AcrR family transcriptional regulator
VTNHHPRAPAPAEPAQGGAGPGRERRRGRQAEAERNDRRVLDAAREVFAEQGPDAPVSAVAQRAGVGMGSLYRRYGSKADLLRHLCLLAMRQTIEAAEDGLAEPDPWAGLAGYVRACVGFGSGSLGALAGTIESTPEMWQASRRSRELLGALLTRAQQSGAVRPDLTVLDIAWLIELFGRHGPTWPAPPTPAPSSPTPAPSSPTPAPSGPAPAPSGPAPAPSSPAPAASGPAPAPPGPAPAPPGPASALSSSAFTASAAAARASGSAVRDRLLAIALAGLRPALADPLPGPAPTPDLYEQRWSTRTTPPGP